MTDKPIVDVAQRHVRLGEASVVVTDAAGIQPVAADLITEIRLVNDVAAISFASYIFDGDGPPEARVSARLRVPLEVLANVQSIVEDMLKDAREAREKAN